MCTSCRNELTWRFAISASSGEKRRNDDGDEDGMGSGSGKRQLRSVRASHLLVKHRDSRRPASWKEPDGCTRSKEEAIAMVQVT